MLVNFIFRVVTNPSATTDFHSLYVEYILMSLSFNHVLKTLFNTHSIFIFQRNNKSIFTKNINTTQQIPYFFFVVFAY